ncbi:hypothetical protein FBY35_1021 [Streptomyces sp. SLBN-118]|nr:hypothetical protein FBY35_1021 [Streptomyces sp. SLBN-118]
MRIWDILAHRKNLYGTDLGRKERMWAPWAGAGVRSASVLGR